MCAFFDEKSGNVYVATDDKNEVREFKIFVGLSHNICSQEFNDSFLTK
jgi:hypothetical protein